MEKQKHEEQTNNKTKTKDFFFKFQSRETAVQLVAAFVGKKKRKKR